MKVILVMAMTVDGMIGKSADHFPDWTGAADKRLFVKLTRQAGAVIMPANPGFYFRPQMVDDIFDFMVARVLDHLGVAHGLSARWGEHDG